MRRIVAGMIVILVILVTLVGPPAEAQTGVPWWTPESPEVVESAGEVVLSLSYWRPGRVKYQTFDWTARAPEDYTAVSGEVVFTDASSTTADASSKTIRIPIIDDALAEGGPGYEAFMVMAWEEPNPDPWPSAPRVTVRIIDDDELNGGGAVATTVTTDPRSQPASSGPVLTQVPTPAPTGDVAVPEVATEVAAPMLEPGPGFELTGEGSLEPPPARGGGGGGSTSSWLAPGLGTAAAGLGAAAFLRRRKQWSPTRL